VAGEILRLLIGRLSPVLTADVGINGCHLGEMELVLRERGLHEQNYYQYGKSRSDRAAELGRSCFHRGATEIAGRR